MLAIISPAPKRRTTERRHVMNTNLTKVASVAIAAAIAPLTMAAITIATAACASAATPTAGFVAQQLLDDDNGNITNPGAPDIAPDPDIWNGGQAAGGTGSASAGDNQAGEPGLWNGGQAAGGTGPADAGPNIGGGPSIWQGGVSAGAS
jgi:hypothetical protein